MVSARLSEVVVVGGELAVGFDELVVSWADAAVEEAREGEEVLEGVDKGGVGLGSFLHDFGYFIEEGFAELLVRTAVPEKVLGCTASAVTAVGFTKIRIDVFGSFLSILRPDSSSED